MYDFDIGKKKMCGAIGIFFFVQTLLNGYNSWNTSSKKNFFFFHMLYSWSAKPSFGWYKVTKNINEAPTTNIRLPGSPKLGT
jgi:hypothetical protein